MRVAVYAPISLWEMHQAQIVDIIWRESKNNAQVTLLSCKKGLVFCASNPTNEVLKCHECIHRTKHLLKEILPSKTKNIWLHRNPTSKETETRIRNVKSHRELEEFSFEGWPVGKTVLSELVSFTRSIYISDAEVKTLAQENLKYAIGMYLQAKDILNDKFDRIYIWGGRRSSEDCVAAAARALSIPIVYFEVGSSIGKYLVTPNEPHSYGGIKNEILSFADKSTSFKRTEISVSAERYFESLRLGNAHTPHFKNFLAGYKEEVPKEVKHSSKPTLTIFTSSAWEFAFFKDREEAPREFLDIYALYLRMSLDVDIHSRFNVIFRWHPNLINAGKLEIEKVDEIVEISKNQCLHIRPGDRVNSYDLLENSNVVVITGSTIGIESAFLGKPTILLGKAIYSGLGSVYEPSSYFEFKKLLLSQPKALSVEGAKLWAHWTSNYGIEFEFVRKQKTHYYFGSRRIGKTSFLLTNLQRIYRWRQKVLSLTVRA